MDKPQAVLFVDDEENILNALRRLLYDEAWESFFANSGEKGLEIIKSEDIDLVVSDVKMPGMDGIAFMSEVKKLKPSIVRIFLSGHADRAAIVQALSDGSAQQLLSKPWKDDELKDVVRTALLQAHEIRTKNKGLQKIINSLTSLRTMPQTYLEVKRCFSHINTVSIESLAEIIEQDASVSAELLRWANSALFSQRRKVDTVERALMILGMEIIEGLVLSHSIFGAVSSGAPSGAGLNLEDFQKHSIACGILTKLLITRISHEEPKNIDRAFTAGLLHDVGKLVEERYFPEQFGKILDAARQNKSLIVDAEYDVLETTHEEIGRHLAEWWSMPAFLVNAIRWHHKPNLCKVDQDIVMAVHVADALVQQFEIGSSGNFQIPEVEKAGLEFFELADEDIPALKEAVIYFMT